MTATADLTTTSPYAPGVNGSTFDLQAFLESVPEEFLATPWARIELTEDDPFLFWIVYGWHHLLRKGAGTPDFADCHFEWARMARTWIHPVTEPRAERDAILAPRETGKSTIWFALNLLWAAAHGHVRYVAAFSDSATQAEAHLATFKQELENNPLLQEDFPDLCAPKLRGRGTTAADRQSMYQSTSGFTFIARGVDSGVLGAKAGSDRPDLIILDDVEPGEANYSPKLAEKRLSTITKVILPLSETARVVLVGTVTMSGSLMDQCSKHAHGQGAADWIIDQQFRVHYHDPTPTNPDGSRRSIWPAKWPLVYLESIEATVDYAMNFKNKPRPVGGTWWRESDIHIEPDLVPLRTVLTIDPAVTTKDSSDFTGFAVASATMETERFDRGQCLVHYATGRKIAHGEPMRAFVLGLCEQYPYISEIVVETNQGGDLHEVALYDMPVPIRTTHTKKSKEVRFAALLQKCQIGEVAFERSLLEFDDQALAYPKVVNDDVIDAVTIGMEETVSRGEIIAVGGLSW